MRGWQYGDASEAGAAVDLPLPGLEEEEEEGERVYVSVYRCVCVCVCVWRGVWGHRQGNKSEKQLYRTVWFSDNLAT